MIAPHGAYIDSIRGVIKMACLDAVDAVDLILEEAHPSVYEDHIERHETLDPKDLNLMLNKGWIPIRVEDERVVCLYYADYNYYLYSVPVVAVLEKAARDLQCKMHRLSDWCAVQGLLNCCGGEGLCSNTTVRP